MRISISEIKVNPERRNAAPADVRELADSIAEIGLLNPVTVSQSCTLIAGLHRLEAAKLLGWTEIECVVSGLEGLRAELAEIDENFVRSDLTPLEFGELLLRRKEIYEALHPESVQTNQGGPFRGNQHQEVSDKMTQTTKSFAQDTAEKLGVGRRTVERQVQIAKNLTPETKDILRGADMPVTRKQALALSRLSPSPQAEAAALLAAGEIQSVEEYAPPVRAGPVPQPGPALTPDTLAAEASQFAQVLQRTVQRCRPEAFAQLTPPQLNILRRQMGSAREAVEKFEKLLEMNAK
nr:ParB N-terminal domain-containing protein [uncultured Oscillibacter sp.]